MLGAIAQALRRTSRLFSGGGGGGGTARQASLRGRRTGGAGDGGADGPGLVATVPERAVTVIELSEAAAAAAAAPPGFGAIGVDLAQWRAAGWAIEKYSYTPGEGAAAKLQKHLIVSAPGEL